MYQWPIIDTLCYWLAVATASEDLAQSVSAALVLLMKYFPG
jgi:hypothetical protein